MKVTNFILAIMFLLFAVVQFNDPDPILWISIYVVMAAICVMAALNRYIKPVMWFLLGAFFAYACFLYPGVKEWIAQPDLSILFDDVMKMQYPYIEESREFLGLIICLIVLLVQLFRSKNS
jgi:hypothetical protein